MTKQARTQGMPTMVMAMAASAISGFRSILETIEQRAPLRRNITLDDIGKSALYLASDLSSGTTGEVVFVDCGYNIMTPGASLRFFTVTTTAEDRYWIGEAADRHLRGWICVLATPLDQGGNRFDVTTVVHYRHWTGPVYFNLIRPFHHLVVACMARAGAKG